MSNSFGRKLSLKSNRSAPNLKTNQNQKLLSSRSMEETSLPRKTDSLLLNIKSAAAVNNRTTVKESQQHLDMMHKMVDQTDNDLRRALEHAAVRREQLDDLHFRSEEMLSKNENLVFGNYNRI